MIVMMMKKMIRETLASASLVFSFYKLAVIKSNRQPEAHIGTLSHHYSEAEDDETEAESDSEVSEAGETEDENGMSNVGKFCRRTYNTICVDWKREAEATLERAFNEGHSIDIAALELNTLKMAMNITFQNLREVSLPAILRLVDLNKAPQSVEQVILCWSR